MIPGWILFVLIVWCASGAESLRVLVVEGDGAINNIRLQRAKEPVVRVETAVGNPVAGAVVHFLVPAQGPGGVFANGAPTATVMTDAEGRAVARGLRPNKTAGQFEIRVTASYDGVTASARITQTNADPVELSRRSSKKIAILAIVGGAVAGGAALAFRGGNKNTSSVPLATPAATVITPGSPSIGAP